MESSILEIAEDDETCGLPGATVRDLDVRLDLQHDFNADLTVWLTSPNGTTLPLFGRLGGGTTGMSVVLDDEAPEEIAGSVTDFSPHRPQSALAGPGLCRFDGEDAVGEWRLDVQDWLGGGTGYLSSWALVLTCSAEGVVHPCAAEPAKETPDAASADAGDGDGDGTASEGAGPGTDESAGDAPAPEGKP